MPHHRWYITGLLLITLIICIIVLGVRWHRLAQRVPLAPIHVSTVTDSAVSAYEPPSEDSAPVTESANPSSAWLNLNRATQVDLERLPGIGPVLAARIIAYRDANGSFATVSDLLCVEGIGEGKLSAIEEFIYVKPAQGE